MTVDCSAETVISKMIDCELGLVFVNAAPWVLSFTLIAYTLVIIWGTRKIGLVLKETADVTVIENGTSRTVQMAGLKSALLKENPGSEDPQDLMIDISKVSVFIGSIGLAALFIGIGYWIIFSLYLRPDGLGDVQKLWTFFLAGSAMFLPYAFSRLSELFRA